MAILQFDGFDHYGNGNMQTATIRANFEAAGFTPFGSRTMTLGTAYGKNAGSYGIALGSSIGTDTEANKIHISKPIKPEQYKSATPYAAKDLVILGFAFRVPLNPTAELTIAKVGDHEVSVGVDMYMYGDGVLTQYQIELGIWNWMEVEVNKRDSRFRIWMNDVMVHEVLMAEPVVNYDKWEIKAHYKTNGSANQVVLHVDDYYLLDATVSEISVANTRLGKINVTTRFPTADGTVQFSRDTGTTSFSRVNQQSPDGDTSFVYSNTVGATDLYSNPTAFPTIDDNAVVAVAVSVSSRQTEPDSLSLAPVVKSGTFQAERDRVGIKAALYTSEKGIFEVDPATGLRWKPAAVVAATFGQKILDKVTP